MSKDINRGLKELNDLERKLLADPKCIQELKIAGVNPEAAIKDLCTPVGIEPQAYEQWAARHAGKEKK